MPYVIKTSSAHMPQSCRGTYRRLAVIETWPGFKAEDVTMISPRARAVKRIVQTWEKLNSGRGVRDAYSRALAEAVVLCNRLQAEETLMSFMPTSEVEEVFSDL